MVKEKEGINGIRLPQWYFSWLPLLLILGGIVLRLRQYIFNRSLWLDEATLTLAMMNKPMAELLTPLDNPGQTPPIGFTIIEKFALQVFGYNEFALRLLPLVAGIAALFLFYSLSRRCVRKEAIPIALTFFALSEFLIYYSSEVKAYSSDMAIATGLLLIAIVMNQRNINWWQALLFGIAGTASLLFSFPSLFVLAGIGLVSLGTNLYYRDREQSTRWILICLIWASGFIVYYIISLRELSKLPILQNYWNSFFMPFPPRSLRDIGWFFGAFKELFDKPAGLALPGLGALAFIVGLVSLYREKRMQLMILLSPIFITLLASAFHKYPFGQRLLIFLSGPIIIIIAAGISETIFSKSRSTRFLGVIMFILLLVHPAHVALDHFVHPKQVQEIRPLLAHVERDHQPGDVLYVYQYTIQRVTIYVDRFKKFDFDDAEIVAAIDNPDQWASPMEQLKLYCGRRVWFIFSHVRPGEEEFLLYHANQLGERLDVLWYTGARAYLYTLNGDRCGDTAAE